MEAASGDAMESRWKGGERSREEEADGHLQRRAGGHGHGDVSSGDGSTGAGGRDPHAAESGQAAEMRGQNLSLFSGKTVKDKHKFLCLIVKWYPLFCIQKLHTRGGVSEMDFFSFPVVKSKRKNRA